MSGGFGTRVSRRHLLQTSGAAAATVAAGGVRATPAAAARPARSAPTVLKQGGGTLRIVFIGTQVSPTDQSIADGFKALYPDADIEFIPVQGTDWNQYFAKILTIIASGTTPDLMTVATEGTQLFAGQGLAAPLDEYVQRDQAAMAEFFADVHPSLVEAMMYEGSLFELPFDWNAANMYLNTALLAQNELAYPAADWDYNAFYEMAKTMTKADGGPPFGYGWVNRLWGSWMPWIFVNGGNLLTEAKAPGGEWLWNAFYADDPAGQGRGGGWRWEAPQANLAANVEALEFVVQMANEGITPSVEVGGGGLLQGFFTSNNLGMTPAGGFWAGGLTEAGMKPDGYDVQLFPKWKSQRHQFGTAGLIMFNDSENKDLAWEYMKYYVGKGTMETAFNGNFSTPARRSMMTAERYAPTGPANWQVFYDTLDKHPDTAPIPAPPQSNEMTTIFMKYTGLALNGEQSPQEALDNMQKDLEALFAAEG